MSIARIKTGDEVVVISGEYAGKTGKVEKVDPKAGTAVVKGVNMVKKAVRRSQENPEGGFVEFEAPIRLCKLMPWDESAKKGVRVSRVKEGDTFVRKAKGTGRVF
ncbi:MAG: 50S ribosomal protein L24 [Kiritimatiellae bacterium]|nr:50S ribosomal protein L24 [Kiritimatiellia bacterium]